MKLKPLLEGFDPRSFLLHLQQLVVDEYPQADVELNHKHDIFTLEVKYFDLKPVTLSLFKRESDELWMIEIHGITTIHQTPFDERIMTPLHTLHGIERKLKGAFEAGVVFEDGSSQELMGDDESWVYVQIESLFKYLGTGRLKKAADIHIVISTMLDDKGLQNLQTRYNSILVNSRKLKPRQVHSEPTAADAKADRREVYILANLE